MLEREDDFAHDRKHNRGTFDRFVKRIFYDDVLFRKFRDVSQIRIPGLAAFACMQKVQRDRNAPDFRYTFIYGKRPLKFMVARVLRNTSGATQDMLLHIHDIDKNPVLFIVYSKKQARRVFNTYKHLMLPHDASEFGLMLESCCMPESSDIMSLGFGYGVRGGKEGHHEAIQWMLPYETLEEALGITEEDFPY